MQKMQNHNSSCIRHSIGGHVIHLNLAMCYVMGIATQTGRIILVGPPTHVLIIDL